MNILNVIWQDGCRLKITTDSGIQTGYAGRKEDEII
jgi:hypothetical protein